MELTQKQKQEKEQAQKQQEPKQQKVASKSNKPHPQKIKMLNQFMAEKQKKYPDRKMLKYFQDMLRDHPYWKKQPTLDDFKEQKPGNIEGKRTVEEVRSEPLDLPREGMSWCNIDLTNDNELEQFYWLLTKNYVEDDDNTYRFDYSRGFLRWALTPPGFRPEWLVGIRNQNKQLVASITGVPVVAVVENQKIKMAQINYLCVHKNERSTKIAALLISEVTRRVNRRDKWQAIYTSGKNLPTPFTRATYYHRSINPKKLIEVKFSALTQNQTLPMVKKLYKIADELTIELKPMSKNDVYGVTKLLNEGLEKFVVKFHYTEEDVKHYFLPRDKIIYTYVVSQTQMVDGKKRTKVTDFLSFYALPSHVMNNPKHNMLYACYSFFNFASTVSYEQLIKNALILAKKQGFDVYNCLNLMDNATVFENLHFQTGDGVLNYYLYNWVMERRKIEPNELGVVLF